MTSASPRPDSANARAIRIPPLTGVRAFAALWVVFHHLRLGPGHGLALPDWLDLVCRLGYLGVDLFGFLSGFVITHNYVARLEVRRRGAVRRYLWLRAVRIFPLYWLALALLVLARFGFEGFDAGAPPRVYATGDLIQQLLMVHGWGFGHLAWNLPSWTVSSEWLCYLAFPLLAPWLAARRAGAMAASFATAALLATTALLWSSGHRDWNATTDVGVLRIAGEFLTGCLLQRAWAAGFGRALPWGSLGLGIALAVAALVAWENATGVVFALALLVYALAHDRGPLSRALALRAVMFLGDASYAIYILHWIVLRVAANAFPVRGLEGGALAGAVALILVAILATGAIAHVAVENPVRRRLRGWVRAG